MVWDSATSSTLRHTKVQSKPSLSFVPTDFLTLHLPSTLCAYFNHNVHPLSPPLQSSFIPIPHPLPPPHILLPYHHPKYKKCCLSARSLGHPNQDHPQRIQPLVHRLVPSSGSSSHLAQAAPLSSSQIQEMSFVCKVTGVSKSRSSSEDSIMVLQVHRLVPQILVSSSPFVPPTLVYSRYCTACVHTGLIITSLTCQTPILGNVDVSGSTELCCGLSNCIQSCGGCCNG